MKSNVSVIGAGNLGSHLINALRAKGYPLKYIYRKSKFDCFASFLEEDMGVLVRESDIVFLCTQESRIPGAVASAAASADPAGKFFFHTANSLTSDELLPLKEKGAFTASFSPLQTFLAFKPGAPPDVRDAGLFKGVYFLAEGDEEALTAAEIIAGDLGAHMITVEKSKKIYFHIAAVCASNFLISILKLSENQLKKAGGGDMNVMLPLIRQILKNVETKGVDASLTGPVKRKEMEVVNRHLRHLAGDDAVLYKALTDFLVQSFS
ncbi:MAG: DUF2520 domain-containing protein [bacterium]|nr:DUF2520 domain-containing protein [bacterium]